MAYIPWRHIASWSCTSCGLCCMRFAVFLTKAESDQMVAHFGRKVVLEHHSGPRLGKMGRRCFFQRWTDETSSCLLQNADLKPSACRIFPFLASPKPLRDTHAKESFFTVGDQELYIYANSRCPSLVLGKPTAYLTEKVLPEIAEIAISGRRRQQYTTSNEETRTAARSTMVLPIRPLV